MNNRTTEKLFCKKLVYKNTSPELKLKPTILLGIIKSEDDTFITFQTGKKEYVIAKICVISIEQTDILFKKEGGV